MVFFGIREISGHRANDADGAAARGPGLLRQFVDGWAYVGRTKMVRGLVVGILAAFAAGGMVVGSAKFYAVSLSAGESAFAILFAMIFVGLGLGIAVGPKLIGALSRRRWFGLSIVLAGVNVALMAFAWHLSVAVILVVLVGVAAGMAFLSGTTLSVPALVGSIMSTGVATANSILVVAFANEQRARGRDARGAALAAGMTRLRPVIMTALAMIIGMVPMAIGIGEGSEQNAPLGRAVIGGLGLATVTTLFFVPVMYSLLRSKPPRTHEGVA